VTRQIRTARSLYPTLDQAPVLARWRVRRTDGYVEATLESVDEPGADETAIAGEV
jgi:hypothetical protein